MVDDWWKLSLIYTEVFVVDTLKPSGTFSGLPGRDNCGTRNRTQLCTLKCGLIYRTQRASDVSKWDMFGLVIITFIVPI